MQVMFAIRLLLGSTAIFLQQKWRGHCQVTKCKLPECRYAFEERLMAWNDAREFCRSQYNSDLVIINDEYEGTFLSHEIQTRNVIGYNWWIGLNRSSSAPGNFIWVDSRTSLNYTNWSPGKPNDLGTGENCVELLETAQWKWNNRQCSVTNYFICESLQVVQIPEKKVALLASPVPHEGIAVMFNMYMYKWGTLCDISVSIRGWPSVVCRELGYEESVKVTSVEGYGPIAIMSPSCSSRNHQNMLRCGTENKACNHKQDLYVYCKPPDTTNVTVTPTLPTHTTTPLTTQSTPEDTTPTTEITNTPSVTTVTYESETFPNTSPTTTINEETTTTSEEPVTSETMTVTSVEITTATHAQTASSIGNLHHTATSTPSVQRQRLFSRDFIEADSTVTSISIGSTMIIVGLILPFVAMFVADLPLFRRQIRNKLLRNLRDFFDVMKDMSPFKRS